MSMCRNFAGLGYLDDMMPCIMLVLSLEKLHSFPSAALVICSFYELYLQTELQLQKLPKPQHSLQGAGNAFLVPYQSSMPKPWSCCVDVRPCTLLLLRPAVPPLSHKTT